MSAHTHQSHSCIRQVPIFNHLDDSIMDLIGDRVRSKEFDKGEFLYHAGDINNDLYIINRGAVKVYRIVESGKEQLIRMLNPGDFVGEWSLFNPGSVQEDYAQAVKKTQVCMLKQEDLQGFLTQYPNISLKILSEMSQRLERSEKQTTHVSTEQVGTRLALFIADQVEGQAVNEVVVELPLSRKDIASYLGSTPETISRKFKELEEEGLITQLSPRKILIHNVDELLFYI